MRQIIKVLIEKKKQMFFLVTETSEESSGILVCEIFHKLNSSNIFLLYAKKNINLYKH